MFQITRNQAREIRAVFKRLLCGHSRRTDPAIQFEAGPSGLTIRACAFAGAIQFHTAGELPDTNFSVPLSTLEACEGKDDSPVKFDVASKKTVSMNWEVGRIPRCQTVNLTAEKALEFPPMPATLVANSPGLLTALQHASQNVANDNTRYILDHLQLDGPKGRIAATDGHHALLQTGFDFPWQDAVLIPASGVYASPEFPRNEPIGVARTEKWLSLSVGPWLIHLPIDKDGNYPKVDAIIPKSEKIVSRLQIADADARFLQDAIPRLPGDEDQHHPVTLDLNGEVIVRATASDQPKPTELVLTNSRLIGEPVKISVNREFLARAMKLGFREIGLINEQSIVTFDDGRRKYLVMPRESDKNAKRVTDAVRIESGTIGAGPPTQRLRVSPSTSNNEDTMPKPKNQQESPAEAKNGSTVVPHDESQDSHGAGPIGAAIELRTSLRSALTGVNTLIASLRRNKRQQRLVQSTLQSLKDLQKIAG